MKKRGWLLTVFLLVAFLGVGMLLYPYLARRYTPFPQEGSESDAGTELSSVTGTSDITEDPTVWGTAPDFTVKHTGGESVRLSDFLGRPIIINFWATWCGPCQSELPFFQQAYEKYGENVIFMMVDLTDGVYDTEWRTIAYAAQNGYTFPLYFDTEGSAAEAYGIYSIPVTVAIDRKGNIAAQRVGSLHADVLETMLQNITEVQE